MKRYIFCSVLFFISAISYASEQKPSASLDSIIQRQALQNSKKRKEEKNIDGLMIPLKYRSDLHRNRGFWHNAYIGRNNEKELSENITKIVVDLVKEKLENSVSQTKTWPSWVDPDDID